MEKRPKQDLFDLAFSKKDFVRTLSYREFVSSLALALLLLGVYAILDYYGGEDWAQNYGQTIRLSFLCILPVVNHIFYKAEHKRPNNFMGRNLHDYIFLLLFLAIFKVKLFFYGSSFTVGAEGFFSVIVLIVGLILVIMLFEMAVAFLRRCLNLLRWQIL